MRQLFLAVTFLVVLLTPCQGQGCEKLLTREKSTPGKLEGSLRLRVYKDLVVYPDRWDVHLTFHTPVNLKVLEIYVGQESGVKHLPGGGATSAYRPVYQVSDLERKVTTRDNATFQIRDYYDIRSVATAYVSFTIRFEASYQGENATLSDVRFDGASLCVAPIETCGEAPQSKFLVRGGETVDPGDWPWLAAIFVKSQIGLNFQCGGTLVTKTHVITAGHCVYKNRKFTHRPQALVVYLGKHKLFDWEHVDRETQPRSVSLVTVHPDFKASGKPKDGDLAVLLLAKPIEITDFVRPACIFKPWLYDEDKLAGSTGMVVGWGMDEEGNPVTEEPKLTRMPVVTNEQCRSSSDKFADLVTNRTYCAGKRDGTGVCNGDSGGGMYVQETREGDKPRWVLRGLVSRSIKKANDECDLDYFVVFTDMAKFVFWLSSGAEVFPRD